MVTNTANRPSHERENNQISSLQAINRTMSTVFVELELQLPSGTVAQCQGLQDIWDICWHAGTLLGHLACWWHSKQTHGTGNQWWNPTLSLWVDSNGTHRMMWSINRMVGVGVCGDDLDEISELNQAVNQFILRKLAQLHKLKNKPKFGNLDYFRQFWTNFDNFRSISKFCIFLW